MGQIWLYISIIDIYDIIKQLVHNLLPYHYAKTPSQFFVIT